MFGDKLTEFVTVLTFAMVIGAGAVLSILYLEETLRAIALFALVAATIVAWQYLRKRFRRG